MENEKLFIGNLNFEATEDGLRELLSQYGTVVSIRLSRKKGHAVVEMSDRSESEAVIKDLDGKRHMERELHISFELSPKKAKAVSVQRFSDKGKSFSSEKEDNPSNRRLPEKESKSPVKRSERYSAEKPSSTHKSRSFGSRHEAPKRHSRDDSDDTRGNRRVSDDNSSSRRDSTDGYYSQSFRKRVESSSQAFSKYKSRESFSERPDDFMKDEKGRDYRDMEKASSRRGAGGRNENFRGRNTGDNSGSRRGDDSGMNHRSESSRGYGNRTRRDSGDGQGHSGVERPGRYTHNRLDDDNAGNRRSPERKFSGERSRSAEGSRTGSSSQHGSSYRGNGSDSSRREPRRTSRDDSGRPSDRPSGNRSRTSSRPEKSRSGEGTGSLRGASRNRPAGRSHNK